ncbi:hypothetical protein [Aliivibrio fischeri]|uniref:hypothetical protein n=1 Tax=Aliivibrio fischeri TaxID=668 RepID=UPI003736082B
MNLKSISLEDIKLLDNYKNRIIKTEPDIYINLKFGLSIFLNDFVKEKIKNKDSLVFSDGVISISYFRPEDYLENYHKLETFQFNGKINKISIRNSLINIPSSIYNDLFCENFEVLIEW